MTVIRKNTDVAKFFINRNSIKHTNNNTMEKAWFIRAGERVDVDLRISTNNIISANSSRKSPTENPQRPPDNMGMVKRSALNRPMIGEISPISPGAPALKAKIL